MSVRAGRVGLAAAATVAATLTLPASAERDQAVALGGVTTVAAEHSGSTKVVLYDDATLTWKSVANPDTSIRGKGRFVSLWLFRDDGFQNTSGETDYVNIWREPAFAGGRTFTSGSAYPQGGCTSWPNDTLPLNESCDTLTPRSILLHQGYYRLVVVTDRDPVKFTLHLHGADGRSTVRPTTPFHTFEAALPQRDGIGDDLVTWGRSARGFDDSSVLFQFVDVSVPSDAKTWGSASCTRYDDGSTPPPQAYGPLCPGGSGGSGGFAIDGEPAVGTDPVYFWGSMIPIPGSGDIGYGGSVWSDRGATFHHALGVWLDNSCGSCW